MHSCKLVANAQVAMAKKHQATLKDLGFEATSSSKRPALERSSAAESSTNVSSRSPLSSLSQIPVLLFSSLSPLYDIGKVHTIAHKLSPAEK